MLKVVAEAAIALGTSIRKNDEAPHRAGAQLRRYLKMSREPPRLSAFPKPVRGNNRSA